MSVGKSIFMFGTMATVITSSSLHLNFTENIQPLIRDGHVSLNGDKLSGEYGDSMVGVTAVSLGLCSAFLLFEIYKYFANKGLRKPYRTTLEKTYMSFLMLGFLLGVISGIVNLHLLENWTTLVAEGKVKPEISGVGTCEFSTLECVGSPDTKVRGTYGNAVIGVNASTVGIVGIAAIIMVTGVILNERDELLHKPVEFESF
jgi:hypothetical protein